MKYLFLIATLLLFACNKETAVDYNMVVGKWELSSQIGGIAGIIKYAPGNGNTILFTADKTYTSTSVSSSGTKTSNGNFTLSDVGNGDLFITYNYQQNNQNLSSRDSVRIRNDSLFFLPFASCCDIPTTIYVKLK